MADIAQLSGIPRTAVYRVFESKEAIFVSLPEHTHTEALDLAKEELLKNHPIQRRIEQAMLARDGHLLRVGHAGPHANEIAELYSDLAGDVTQRFNQSLERALIQAIKQAIAEQAYQLPKTFHSIRDCARVLRLSLEGIKIEHTDLAGYSKLSKQVIRSLLAE